MSKLSDVKGVGAGPYFVTEGDDDELGAKWYMVNGPGIPDPKMTATTDRDEAIVSASIRNRAYAEGLRMAAEIANGTGLYDSGMRTRDEIVKSILAKAKEIEEAAK